jgi:type IV pilus assembly protein PilB
MKQKISNKAIDKLKYDLVREGLLDYNQLVDAIELARERQVNLGEILIQNNIIREEELLNFLEKKLHIPYVNLDDYAPDTKTANLITKEEATKHKLLPLFIIEDTMTIAMADPLDLFALNNLSISQEYRLEPVICSEKRILKTIKDVFYTDSETLPELTPERTTKIKASFNWQTELNESNKDEVNMYRLVKAIIYQAITENASDIHLDPQEDELLVRFRLDGLLYNRGNLPILLATPFLARVKSAAGMNVEEQTLPQQGRLEINFDKVSIVARTSTFPTGFGERATIKIFTKSPPLHELGFEGNQLEICQKALSHKSGIIVAASPLGQGQTTTFYAILEYLQSEHKNIISLENPIRYKLPGISQSIIDNSHKLPFKDILEALLLQEPDILYIDEITDKNNFELIAKAALAEKLVLTSITAHNAAGTLFQLLASGIEPQIILNAFNTGFAQKLVRLLCPNCKKETHYPTDISHKYGLSEDSTCYKPSGCQLCNNTGFKGRTAIFEFFTLDEEIKDHLAKHSTETQFTQLLKSKEHTTIAENALKKVQKGLTTIEEVKHLLK